MVTTNSAAVADAAYRRVKNAVASALATSSSSAIHPAGAMAKTSATAAVITAPAKSPCPGFTPPA
jgi:hypothetical protein